MTNGSVRPDRAAWAARRTCWFLWNGSEIVVCTASGEQGMAACEEQVRTLYDQMARIVLTPDWAKVLDFGTRAPEFVHQLAAAKGLGPPS